MRETRHIHVDPSKRIPLLRDPKGPGDALRVGKTHTHPVSSGKDKPEDASICFIGNATTIIEWQGMRILTDPNFLHAGDHVHLGPGVTAQRLKDPAIDLDGLPPVDLVLLSHYHEDHFDRLVEERLNRDFVIITTPHAKECLTASHRYTGGIRREIGELVTGKGQDEGDGPFRAVYDVDTFESVMLHIEGEKTHHDSHGKVPMIRVVAMPGKHIPPGPLAVANELLGAVPPTNGWLLEMGWSASTPSPSSGLVTGVEGIMTELGPPSVNTGYRIYISGDTLFVDELREIPKYIREQQLVQHPHPSSSQSPQGGDLAGTGIDLMLIHLGGTTIPGPKMPLLMVTMDAKQGIELMKLLNPDLTIPVHFDDYDVMLSSLADFKEGVANMGEEWRDRVVYLDRGDQFKFMVRET